jgi:hypothetical protein
MIYTHQKRKQRKEQKELQLQLGGGENIPEKVLIDLLASNFLRPCPPKTNEEQRFYSDVL